MKDVIKIDETRGLWRGKIRDEIHAEHNGKWMEGDLLCDIHQDGTRGYSIASRKSNVVEVYLVDTSTLGECIGLIDKNGVKIFEGDIILCRGKMGIVHFNTSIGIPCFTTGIGSGSSTALHPYKISKQHEVIGNIHDNPELLEKAYIE